MINGPFFRFKTISSRVYTGYCSRVEYKTKSYQFRGACHINCSSRVSVRCCVVLCGVVWCYVILCGVVWCCVVMCGVVWCYVILCGVVWCCVVLCGAVWCCVVLCGDVMCGVVWCCVVLCGVVWCCKEPVTSTAVAG